MEGVLWVSCLQPFSEDLLQVEELKEQEEMKKQEGLKEQEELKVQGELEVWLQAASVPQRLRAWPVENFLAGLQPHSCEQLGFWACHSLQQSLY